MTYAYTDSNREMIRYAFFIEHDEQLAKRIGQRIRRVDKVRVADLEPRYMNLVSVFQYLIGNTDFSPVKGPEGEECCHNHTLFGSEGEHLYSVPYDFDQSGLVDAPHAAPNPRFRLRSVRDRLYRGRCANNALLPATLERYREEREEIIALFTTQEDLSKRTRNRAQSFIDNFYKTINDPKLVEKLLVRKCI